MATTRLEELSKLVGLPKADLVRSRRARTRRLRPLRHSHAHHAGVHRIGERFVQDRVDVEHGLRAQATRWPISREVCRTGPELFEERPSDPSPDVGSETSAPHNWACCLGTRSSNPEAVCIKPVGLRLPSSKLPTSNGHQYYDPLDTRGCDRP